MDSKTDMMWRVYLLYFIMCLFGVSVLIGVIVIKLKYNSEYREKEEDKRKFKEVKAMRGNIVANDGSLLATSVPNYDIFFDPISVKESLFNEEISKLSDSLSRMLKKKTKAQYISNFKYLKEYRPDGSRYVSIARNLSMDEYKRIKQFPIFREGKNRGGFIVEMKYGREYPYGVLAKRTIGYVKETVAKDGSDSLIVAVGLEGAYNDYLKGENGRRYSRLIKGGFWMPESHHDNMNPISGDDVYTSIDINIQDVAETALLECLVKNKAEQGCVVMMDVKSGFVEVMASLSYNSKTNEYEERSNYALSNNVEPGSVFKVLTMTALLENNPSFNIDDKVFIGKSTSKVFYRRTMNDSHLVSDENGYTTVRNAFEQSSNIAFATLVDDTFKNEPEKFLNYIYQTKIHEDLNLDIKGAAKPFINNPEEKLWSKLSLPWMSMGYEVQFTPIQLLTYYNAIANDGVMVKPQFVKEIRRANEVIKTFDTVVINERIASERTIETLQELLLGVTQNGTAKALSKLSFSVAGKTGTAQISTGGGYNKKNYSATFVGYFPADNPKYTCIVMVSNPSSGSYYGASVALPVFKEVAEKVYATRLGIKEETGGYEANCNAFLDASMVNYEDLIHYCNTEHIPFEDNIDNQEWVDVSINKDESVCVNPVSVEEGKMPNVEGMNISDAVNLLESMGWKVNFTGYGKVKTQSVKAGATLRKGAVIDLKLSTK